jgi:flagellar M-ring protein FliF
VRVNVAAFLRPDIVEETEELWDPASVVRSRETSTETLAAGAVRGGVAGARANQPPALSTATAAPSAAAPGAVVANAATGGAAALEAETSRALPGRSSETTNYEIGKVTRHTVSPQGQLERLSVAVILDDERVITKAQDGTVQTSTKPWEAEGIQRVQGLVSAAVGLDTARGDQLTVENIAFGEPPAPEEAPAGPVWQELPKQMIPYAPQILRLLAVVTIVTMAFLMVLRPMMRAAFPMPQLRGVAIEGSLPQSARTVADLEGAIEAELDAALGPIGEGRRLPVLTKRIARRAEEQPEEVAKLVRTWLTEEDR